MPKTSSAKKALRQNITRHAKNLSDSKKMKDSIKTFKKLIADKKIAEAQKHLSSVYKVLDKSAKTNLIKKNKASRLKSRLAHQLSAISSKASS